MQVCEQGPAYVEDAGNRGTDEELQDQGNGDMLRMGKHSASQAPNGGMTYHISGECPAVAGDSHDCYSERIPAATEPRVLDIEFGKIVALNLIGGDALVLGCETVISIHNLA